VGLLLGTPSSQVQSILFSGTLGTAEIDYDRITIPNTGGATANLQDTDATVEVWLRPHATNNDNTGAQWVNGNIFMDNDKVGGGTGGQWGMSILGGVVAVGISLDDGGALSGYDEFAGTTDITDDAWHHIVWTLNATTGAFQLYVDGSREVNSTASTGNGNNLGWLSGGDAKAQLLELGGEKNDQESGDSLSYFGYMSEIRISSSVLYSGASISVPTSPLDGSGAGVAYYGFTEGSGTTIADGGGGKAPPDNPCDWIAPLGNHHYCKDDCPRYWSYVHLGRGFPLQGCQEV
jgi:hypothetical protein